MNTELVKSCICNDVARIIKCNWCGHELKARIRRICEKHPRVIHLMGIVVCPKCKCKFKFFLKKNFSPTGFNPVYSELQSDALPLRHSECYLKNNVFY